MKVPNVIVHQPFVARPPDGLLGVNWNHPVSNGLKLLVPLFGRYAIAKPSDLVGGDEGDYPYGSLPTPNMTRIGIPGLKDQLNSSIRIRNVPLGPTQDMSGMFVFVHSASGSIENYGSWDAWGETDTNEGVRFQPYTYGSLRVLPYLNGATPITTWTQTATTIYELSAAAYSLRHDGTDWYGKIVSWCPSKGVRVSTFGPSTNNAWNEIPRNAWLLGNGNSTEATKVTVFFGALWNRELSTEEMSYVVGPNNLWTLFKPTPKYYLIPEGISTALYGGVGRGIAEGVMRGVG